MRAKKTRGLHMTARSLVVLIGAAALALALAGFAMARTGGSQAPATVTTPAQPGGSVQQPAAPQVARQDTEANEAGEAPEANEANEPGEAPEANEANEPGDANEAGEANEPGDANEAGEATDSDHETTDSDHETTDSDHETSGAEHDSGD